MKRDSIYTDSKLTGQFSPLYWTKVGARRSCHENSFAAQWDRRAAAYEAAAKMVAERRDYYEAARTAGTALTEVFEMQLGLRAQTLYFNAERNGYKVRSLAVKIARCESCADITSAITAFRAALEMAALD